MAVKILDGVSMKNGDTGVFSKNAVPEIEEKINLLAFIGYVNKFNSGDVQSGYWNTSNGVEVVANNNYRACNTYVPVDGGKTYNLFYINNGSVETTAWHYVAWYDSNKNFISGSPITTTTTTAPANASYVRLSAQSDKYTSFMVVESPLVPSAYIPFVLKRELNAGVSIPIVNEFLETEDINKFNSGDVQSGYWETTNGTTIAADNNYKACNTYVPVDGGKTYNLYWVNNGVVEATSWHYVAWYDAAKNFISGSSVSTTSVTAPANAALVRFSAQTEKYETFMAVESGTIPAYYIPYGLTKSIKDDVILPSHLNGVKIDVIGDSWSAINNTASVKYTNLLAGRDGADVNILAVSGSGYHKPTSSNKPFYTQANSTRTDADIVVIFGSFNDVSDIIDGTTIGETTDTGTTTICGCINTTISNIISRNPAAKIIVIAPGPWQGYNAGNYSNNANNARALEYVEALKNVCYYRGVEFVDFLRLSNLKPWLEDFRTDYQPDGTHPNNAGHEKYLYPRIKSILEML